MNLFAPNQFFLVWSPSGSTPPTFKHESRQSAVTEAERLARIHRGKTFFVLAATDSRVVDDMVRTSFTVDEDLEIPF